MASVAAQHDHSPKSSSSGVSRIAAVGDLGRDHFGLERAGEEQELLALVRGDVGEDAAVARALEEPVRAASAAFRRCGPRPTVCTTLPIAPAAPARPPSRSRGSRNARSSRSSRSGRSRPARGGARRAARAWSTPGLSTHHVLAVAHRLDARAARARPESPAVTTSVDGAILEDRARGRRRASACG